MTGYYGAADAMRIVDAAIDQVVPGTRGGSTHVSAVASEFAALGHEVHVATGRGDGPPRDPAVHWPDIAAPLERPHLRLLRTGAIKRLVARVRPDAVIERYHNFGGEGLIAARGAGALRGARGECSGRRLRRFAEQRLDRALLVEPMRRWRDWQCRTADLIVTPTREILPSCVDRPRARNREPRRHSAISPAAVGPLPFTRRADETVAIFAGAFRAWHGAVHLVDALAQLEARGRPSALS